MIRVRFAPSPTGYLHVGGARTALFNWLYARRHGGTFVLRIEDTDAERSSWEMVTGIVDGLRWLGLDWDEGPDIGGPHAPYFQSERLDRYRAMADRLVAEGRAYYCYCSTESMQAKRQAAEAAGGGWMYDRTCLARPQTRSRALAASGAPRAVRFKVPAGETRFDDSVPGSIAFDNTHIEDFVILRSDRQPTYHLTVVADDIDMAITDVVRGDDHISNTPKQVLLYQAFEKPTPRFAHVPLILGPDKKRLSKRHGATSVMEYHRLGYLPEAMVNFLALLGWSPGTDQEIFTRDELVARVRARRHQRRQRRLQPGQARLVQPAAHHAADVGAIWPPACSRCLPRLASGASRSPAAEREWFLRVLELLQPRARKLGQFVDDGRPFFADAIAFDDAAVKKHLAVPGMRAHLQALVSRFREAQPFDRQSSELMLRSIADERVRQARTAHPRDARRGHGSRRQPWPVRSAGTAGPGPSVRSPRPCNPAGRGVRSYTVCASTA